MSLQYFKQHIFPVKDKLYRFAYRLLGNAMDAEDVVQEVFLKIWKKQEEWASIENMDAWCMTMAKNMSIDKLRSSRRFVEESIETAGEKPSDLATPLESATQADLSFHLRKAMDNLPDKFKMAIHLRDIEGLSYDEIADIMQIPLNQVKINLFRARNAIRQTMLKSEVYGL